MASRPHSLGFPSRALIIACGLLGGIGCKETGPTVVAYCSVDESFARLIFDQFEVATGIEVRVVFDSEAGKTTGLINRVRSERGRPRADVLFSSEVFNTIRLASEGLLAEYDSPAAADVPASFRSPEHRWAGIGVRGRVLAFDPKRIDRKSLPLSWEEVSDPQWASRLAMANPLFGTSRGHVAAMFAVWGRERATEFLKELEAGGVLMVDGNSSAVRAVMDGRADLCMTDTDDVWLAQRAGASLDLVYPDMGWGGTLWIPSTVAMIRGAPHPKEARRLVDFLVSAEVEELLARSDSGNVPVRSELRAKLGAKSFAEPPVGYAAIAAAMDESSRLVTEILLK